MTNPLFIHPIQAIFRSKQPAPRPVVTHLVHFPEIEEEPGQFRPEFWTVRLYRDNFDAFSKEDQLVIFNWVSDIIKSMRAVEPRSYVEVHERVPR